MSDSPEPPNGQPASWEQQLEDASQDATPPRRTAFDAARKKTFLKALAKGATLKEAAQSAHVSRSTVYLHQKEDANFAAACLAAQKVIAPVVELAAFDRAVTGVEEDVIQYGKHVGTRVKRSDALLQTLLKGSNPEKYGPQAGTGQKAAIKALRKKWRDKERKRLRKQIEAELEKQREAEENISEEEADEIRARIMRRLERLRQREIIPELVQEGWTYLPEIDHLVPPGWKLVPIGHGSDEQIARPTCPMSDGRTDAAPALG